MNTTEIKKPEDNLVYVRPVNAIELPEEVREQIVGTDRVYAVHNSLGTCLALVKNREMAFILARQHDLAPVNVH